MTSIKFVKKIKNYAVISFLLPLIAINSCFLLYKFIGDIQINIDASPNLSWNKVEHTYSWNEYNQIYTNLETYTFTNCSKYGYSIVYTSFDNQTIQQGLFYTLNHFLTTRTQETAINNKLVKDSFVGNALQSNKKIKSITIIKRENILNNRCIKNHQFLYSLLKKFSWLETVLIQAIQNNPVGFSKIKNPYFYGEASISRTARYFPIVLIFKPLIILSALFLFLYWKSNLNLFSELKNKNIFDNFSKKFFYLGVFSCIFLILHATLLGLDYDSKLFTKVRRLIIILFILFEISAQILLTKNLFRLREELKKYINPLILKIKIFFVIIIFFMTCAAFAVLTFGDPSTTFKHILEWNYFSALLLYYMLSRLLWK